MSCTHVVVTVDDQLQWVVRVRETYAGAARASSPAQLAACEAQLHACALARREREQVAAIIACAVETTLELVGAPPDLPFIGEPFGGVEGSD